MLRHSSCPWRAVRNDIYRPAAVDVRKELYGQRQTIIEPVFADTKFNRGIERFRRRGRAAVRAEWRLITATHNLRG
jgi:Transposase DDE domain